MERTTSPDSILPPVFLSSILLFFFYIYEFMEDKNDEATKR